MLTLLTLAAGYIAIAFTVSSLLLDAKRVTMQVQLTYTLLALALAFGFQPVKRLFDRASTRLFYQDAYDPQELINRLSRILVATTGADQLLIKTTDLIEDRLKLEFATAVLVVPGMKTPRIVGGHKKRFMPGDLAAAHAKLSTTQSHRHIIVTDNLGADEVGLRELLTRNGIAVLVQLTSRGRDNDKQFGHIMLGVKKSGIPYETRDIQVIEAIADELVVAIQNALRFEEIENFNLTLRAKVDEATRQLRRTNEKLQTLDATKDEFISMASHQLRTPLTSVKGYLSMVLEGDVGPINEQQRQMLEQSYNSSQRMVYLISDLLNLSRLNTGKFVIETTSVDLSEVVQVEVEQLAETAKSRQLTLTYQRPVNFPRLMLDETKIHQVVMNLIDNAIYYTPSGGTVTVDLKVTATAVEFTVTDTGIGVPKKVQHKLFSKFYRAGNAQAARPDGTGLGLFMAKKVVVAQGGAIIFDSTEGKGSTFGFRFSKAKHLAATEPTGVHRTKAVALSK
jgi:signal transduction histidine kinase